jgi:phosphate starvation-inducible protein PhoH
MEITVPSPDTETLRLLLGNQDETRRLIERELPVKIIVRGDSLVVQGEENAAQSGADLLGQLIGVARKARAVDVLSCPPMCATSWVAPKAAKPWKARKPCFPIRCWFRSAAKAWGHARSARKGYVEALRKGDLVFSIGPSRNRQNLSSRSPLLSPP